MTSATIRGFDLQYDLSGADGDVPFVWGHGLTSSRWSEDRLPMVDLEAVRADRPVVRYDARGHGESGSLTGPDQGRWSELALDQIALIDHLGFDRVDIGGASMGAATALHAALTLGERVRRLVLVIPPTAWEKRAEQVDQYRQMAEIVEAKGIEPLVAGAADRPAPDPFLGDDGYLERRIETLRHADPVRLAAAFLAAGRADLPTQEQIATVGVPTLVLAWSGDPGHPVSTAERLGDLLADVEVVISSTADQLTTWTDRTRTFLAQD